MREFTITLEQLPKAWRREVEENYELAVQACREAAHLAETIVVAASPVDQGFFRNAWFVRNVPKGAELVNDAPHAAIVEEGTRPHWPPREPIRAWLVRNATKLGIDPSDEKELNRITFLVCRKIATEGTEPAFILKSRQIQMLQMTYEIVQQRLNLK